MNHSQIYEKAHDLIENMLEKVGDVVDLSASKIKQLITTRTTDEITSGVEVLASQKLSNKIELADSALPKINGETEIWIAGKLAQELGGAGSKLQEAILAKLTAPIAKPRFIFETGACFVAGTLVHTKEGLVPIEKLKVGDWVLSQPENGEGERAYKRVVNTFVHHDKEIKEIAYHINDEGYRWLREGEKSYKVTSTLDHPFWVEGEGWTAAELLDGWSKVHRLQVLDGSPAEVYNPSHIYATDRPGIGWIAVYGKESRGILWDYDNNQLISDIQDDQGYDWENWPISDSDDDLYAPFKTTVYNIEVEDYHTYFVGELGVWVHNANCDGVKLWAGGDPSQAILPAGTKLFESQKALTQYFSSRSGNSFFVARDY